MDAGMYEEHVKELLKKHFIFSILDDQEREQLLTKMEMATFAMGETIITQGEMGDCAYLLVSGKVRVFQQNRASTPITLGTLARGDLFGERSIVTKEPRIASVRASEDVVAFRIHHDDFEQLLHENAALQPYFAKYFRELAIINFLRVKTFIGALAPRQILAVLDKLHEVTFHSGETILHEGGPYDIVYIIRTGTVKVVRVREHGEELLASLSEGDYFGERALLLQEPRKASVVATQDTTCLTLNYEEFTHILASSPKLQAEFRQRLEQYRDAAAPAPGVLSPATHQPAPPQLTYTPVTPVTSTGTAATPPSRRRLRPRLFKRYPWVRQHDASDCGAACLAMISRWYGVRLSIGRLRDLLHVGRDGTSLYNIAVGAEALGYMTRAVHADYAALTGLDLPAIAHWQGYHYIVLYEVTKTHVIIGDPAVGLLKLRRQAFERQWTGRLLLLTPTSSLAEVEPARTSVKRFLPLLKPHRTLLLEVFLASLLLELFALALPIFTQIIVDKVLAHNNVRMLNLMLGGMVVVGLFRTITSLLRHYLLIHISSKLALGMASELFHRVIKLPLGYFRTRTVGDLMTRFNDNAKVRQLLTGASITTLLDVLLIGVYLSVMLYYNAKLAAVALLFMPLLTFLTLIFTPRLRLANQQMFAKQAALSSSFVESIAHIDTIKAATAELPSRWRFENLIVQQVNAGFHSTQLTVALQALSATLQMAFQTVLLWYGAHLVLQAELTVGQLVAFQSLMGMVLTPIMGLISMWHTVQDTLLSLERLNDIYDAKPEESADRAVVPLPSLRGRVTFEHVSFRYHPDDKNILTNIHLDILPGQTCAIVGRSGSGKTTLMTLLQRLYQPTEGRILVDGYDIAAVAVQSLRSQMGVVLQDSAIFTGTIRDNIAMAEPEASLEKVIAAAHLANAHDFIMTFPLGYATVVGELGIKLSGGQKQRLCIARALFQNPRLIIFDEATSALDSESERAIQQNMQMILKDRTAIIIAHRLSTIQYADLIVVLDNGVIVEQGTHQDLLEKHGLYYYLNSQQLTM